MMLFFRSSYWKNKGNMLRLQRVGNALSDLGWLDKAVTSYRTALQITPGFAEGHCNLGNTL